MPKVDGKEYPYTEEGKKAAAAAKKRTGGDESKASLWWTPERNIMRKGGFTGEEVQYKTLDEKQHDIRKQGKAKADEKAARKRGVDAHEAKERKKGRRYDKWIAAYKQKHGKTPTVDELEAFTSLGPKGTFPKVGNPLMYGDAVLGRAEKEGEKVKKVKKRRDG